MKLFKRVLALILTIVVVTQVGVSDRYTITSYAASSVRINKEKVSLVVGKSQTLKVIGTKKKVKWSSDNKKVATVSNKGKITAKKYGSTNVKAKVGKKTYRCKVRVYNKTAKLTRVSKYNQTVYVGKKITLKAKVIKPKKGASPISWSSSNKKIATVSSKGVVLGKKTGKTKITAKSGSKKVTFNVTVKVKSKDAIDVNIDEPTPSPNGEDGSLVLNVEKNQYETVEKSITLSGTVTSKKEVKAISCVCENSKGEKETITVKGTKNWYTENIPLSAGENYITITARNEKIADTKNITVIRYTPELELEDNVIEIGTSSADDMEVVKDISDGILGVESNVVDEKEIISIAVTNLNPLYQYSHYGDWTGDNVLFIPQNEYFISGLSVKYLRSDDNNTFVSNDIYNADTCEILYVEKANLDEVLTEDNYMEYDGISDENPIAFVSSPFESEVVVTDDLSRSCELLKSAQKSGGDEKPNPSKITIDVKKKQGELNEVKISGNLVLYDEDGNLETKTDQITADISESLKDMSFDGKLDFPNQITSILEYTQTDAAKIEIGTGLDNLNVSEINEKIYGVKNETSFIGLTFSGADLFDNTIILGAVAFQPGVGFMPWSMSESMNMSKAAGILPVVYVGVTLEGELKIKVSINCEQTKYCKQGVNVQKKSVFTSDKYAKSATYTKEMNGYNIDVFDITGKSKSEPNKTPQNRLYIEADGTAKLYAGPSVGVCAAVLGIIPFYMQASVGLNGECTVKGQAGISNYPFESAQNYKIKDGLYLSSNADFKIYASLQGRVKSDFELNIKEETTNFSIPLSYENEVKNDFITLGSVEGKNITGKVVDAETSKPISGANVVVKNSNGKELLKKITNEEGRFEKYVIDETIEELTVEVDCEGYRNVCKNSFSGETICMYQGSSTEEDYDGIEVDGTYYDLSQGKHFVYCGIDTYRFSDGMLIMKGEQTSRVQSNGFLQIDWRNRVDKIYADFKMIDGYYIFGYLANATVFKTGDNFDTSDVMDMRCMFFGCRKLKHVDLRKFDTNNVTAMNGMFAYVGNEDNKVELDLSSFDTSSVVSMNAMFEWGYFKSINFDNINTSNVTSMVEMFHITEVDSIDLSHFDTSNVTNMRNMFANFKYRDGYLDLRSFNTSNVTNMYGMFQCSSINEVDLRSFDTHNVEDMGAMFYDSWIHFIYVSDGWETSQADKTDMWLISNYCNKVTYLDNLDDIL